VNDRVHPVETVDLVGKAAPLLLAREATDDNIRAEVRKVSNACCALRIACMYDNLVTVLGQSHCG
jgi:hypothetical protein